MIVVTRYIILLILTIRNNIINNSSISDSENRNINISESEK